MRFVTPAGGGRTGVVGVDLWAAPGSRRKFDAIDFSGVRWRLVARPGAASSGRESECDQRARAKRLRSACGRRP